MSEPSPDRNQAPSAATSLIGGAVAVEGEVAVAEATRALRALAGKNLVNLATGLVAQINTKQRNKILCAGAVTYSLRNGFARGQHNAAAARLDLLFRHARQIETRADRKGDPNIASIKRLAVPVRFGDREGVALLTVKESPGHGHKIYTLELRQKKKLREKGNPPCGDATHGASGKTLE